MTSLLSTLSHYIPNGMPRWFHGLSNAEVSTYFVVTIVVMFVYTQLNSRKF